MLYDDLSVWEHLEYVAALHGVDDWQTPGRELVKTLRARATAPTTCPSKFSRGMRQKTALAVALVRPAALVIIDEPFVGLDMKAQAAFIDVLVAHAAAGAPSSSRPTSRCSSRTPTGASCCTTGACTTTARPTTKILDALQPGE